MTGKPFYLKQELLYLLTLLSAIAYYILVYKTSRENFQQVICLFTFLFAAYLAFYNFFFTTHFNVLIISGVVFRILLLFCVPNLSDDVYRFIWDGRLGAHGINPFSHLPLEIMQMPSITGINVELFGQLNSPGYYTIYPPVLQGIFWVTGKMFPVNVFEAIVFMKFIILMIELGNFFLLIRILKKLSLPKYLSLLYILNPLVITELTGNVHFEGVMIFFVLLSFLLLLKNNWPGSAICLGLGIATKLLPVLFLPLIFYKLGWKKGFQYAIVTGILSVLLFAIVFDISTIQHMLKSVDLFFRKFEFNASIYYLLRYFVTLVQGYNMIIYTGPFLILISMFIILFLSFNRKNIPAKTFFTKALMIITTWFIFSTTVHPWYICMPVVLTIFTCYHFAIIWSFTATFSYMAYQINPVKENLWLVAAGYILVMGYAVWEIRKTPGPDINCKGSAAG